ILLVLTAIVGIMLFDRKSNERRVTTADLPLFGAITVGAGVVAFFLFLSLARLPTQPWYYLSLMTLVATAMDAALSEVSAQRPAGRAAFVAVMVCVSFPGAYGQAQCRQTNIDLIARHLQAQAKPGDLIIVYPWHCGVTFGHYYDGKTPWTTLPALADHRLHRYDLLMQKLAATAPIQDVLDRVTQT